MKKKRRHGARFVLVTAVVEIVRVVRTGISMWLTAMVNIIILVILNR